MNDARPTSPSVPLKYLRSILQVAEAQGFDARALTADIALDIDPLDRGIDPEQAVPADLYNEVYTRVMWLLEDESFGLNLGRRTPAGTFRMMCMCIIHCTTLETAIRRAHEFNSFCQRLTGESAASGQPLRRHRDGSVEFFFDSSAGFLEGFGDAYTAAHTVAIWRRFCSWLIGRPMELIEVRLQAPAPQDDDYLRRLLRCELRFEQAHTSLRFPASLLDAPLIHTEESLHNFLRNAPYYLLVGGEEDDGSLLAQMRRIVGNDLSREFPAMEEMATHLHLSVRTLRRRLKECGTTYQQFKDSLRRDAALRLLRRPELRINAISALLGFDEPSAFHRSFKKWTGQTPGEYREQHTPAQTS